MNTPSSHDLIKSLNSNVCPACGRNKRSSQTFCGPDYHTLSQRMRMRLYDRLGVGYAEAVVAAMQSLGQSIFLLPSETAEPEQLSLFDGGPREGIQR